MVREMFRAELTGLNFEAIDMACDNLIDDCMKYTSDRTRFDGS